MKKYLLIILLAFPALLFAQQTKFGHVSPEEIMEMMPGFDTAQNAMLAYQTELQTEGQEMLQELQLKNQEYEKNYASYSTAVRNIKEEELRAMYSRIEEFSASIERTLEMKKYELLLPFQEKILNTIKEVGKEGNFTYIFNKSILSYSADGEDITDKVKSKLGIK